MMARRSRTPAQALTRAANRYVAMTMREMMAGGAQPLYTGDHPNAPGHPIPDVPPMRAASMTAEADQQMIDDCLTERIDQRAAALRAIDEAKERWDGAPLHYAVLDDGYDAATALGHLDRDVAVLEPFASCPF